MRDIRIAAVLMLIIAMLAVTAACAARTSGTDLGDLVAPVIQGTVQHGTEEENGVGGEEGKGQNPGIPGIPGRPNSSGEDPVVQDPQTFVQEPALDLTDVEIEELDHDIFNLIIGDQRVWLEAMEYDSLDYLELFGAYLEWTGDVYSFLESFKGIDYWLEVYPEYVEYLVTGPTWR
jgi:hypothetical protein